jgi:hypothetical protein
MISFMTSPLGKVIAGSVFRFHYTANKRCALAGNMRPMSNALNLVETAPNCSSDFLLRSIDSPNGGFILCFDHFYFPTSLRCSLLPDGAGIGCKSHPRY